MLRGVQQHQEVQAAGLIRDTRPLSQKFLDFLKNPKNIAVAIVGLAVLTFVYPEVFEIFLLLGIVLAVIIHFQKQTLPMRLPLRSKMKDHNDPLPGSTKPRMARGIAFFGNDRFTNEEIWFNNDDMRTHALIFGSTGSGKTEALASIAFNALVHASGFIYVDGKGDNSLFAKIFSMSRAMGREDDILLINFMTGARDIIGAQERRLSNTMNPFSDGSSSMLTQLVVSLMGSSGGGGDGDMWKGRAISFVEALMKVLVYMRDDGAILLDANTIRNYFDLKRLETIAMDQMFPRDDQEAVSLSEVPTVVLEPLKNYVLNLPGYNVERKGKQVSQVLEQHGFITMQLTRVFSSLADAYGHIIRTNLAEVDFKDVVLNRRVLVVLLPALEKSPDELSNLGKIIIASLKAMMAAGLGDEVEGDFKDVIERKPTNAPTPFLCILDEYGYYAVQGFAVVPAQARSLGFSAIFAGQDLPAFQKASKEEAASIGANTNIKICMKLEDPVETWDFFSKTAGEAYVTKVDSFQTKENSVSNSYLDAKSASFERRSRIDLLDLKDQTEGQSHIFFKSKIVRASMFYANPRPVKTLRINQFLKVEEPSDALMISMKKRFDKFDEIFAEESISFDAPPESAEISMIAKAFEESKSNDLIEASVDALLSFQNKDEVDSSDGDEWQEFEGVINLFTPMRLNEDLKRVVQGVDMDSFTRPLVVRSFMRSKALSFARVVGVEESLVQARADDLIGDIRIASTYPDSERPAGNTALVIDSAAVVCGILEEALENSDEALAYEQAGQALTPMEDAIQDIQVLSSENIDDLDDDDDDDDEDDFDLDAFLSELEDKHDDDETDQNQEDD